MLTWCGQIKKARTSSLVLLLGAVQSVHVNFAMVCADLVWSDQEGEDFTLMLLLGVVVSVCVLL